MGLPRIAKLATIARVPLYRRGLINGAAAAVEHERLLNQVSPRTVLDVGANKGQFSLAAKRVHPNAKILAFEPLKEPAEVFKRHFRGDRNVSLEEVAVDEDEGERPMFISRRQDSSSLLPIGESQVEIFPGCALAGRQTVSVRRLEQLVKADELPKPILLKADVQGAELGVIRSAADLLDEIEYIYVEVSFQELYVGQALAWQVDDYVRDRGFRMSGLWNPKTWHGRVVQCDAFYSRISR